MLWDRRKSIQGMKCRHDEYTLYGMSENIICTRYEMQTWWVYSIRYVREHNMFGLDSRRPDRLFFLFFVYFHENVSLNLTGSWICFISFLKLEVVKYWFLCLVENCLAWWSSFWATGKCLHITHNKLMGN